MAQSGSEPSPNGVVGNKLVHIGDGMFQTTYMSQILTQFEKCLTQIFVINFQRVSRNPISKTYLFKQNMIKDNFPKSFRKDMSMS